MEFYWIAASLVKAAFVFLVGYAMVSDLRVLRIPNWVSLGLVATFAVHALTASRTLDLPMHLAVGAIVLVVTFGLFAMNWLGGGDAKLMSALALWAGPPHVIAFIFWVGLLGGLMAVALLALKQLVLQLPTLENYAVIARPVAWARDGAFPYGVPIGVAAFLIAPSLF